MRLPSGLVPAAAIWLFAGTAAAQVSGAIIAVSAREFSRPHDVVPSPNGAFQTGGLQGRQAVERVRVLLRHEDEGRG